MILRPAGGCNEFLDSFRKIPRIRSDHQILILPRALLMGEIYLPYQLLYLFLYLSLYLVALQ